MHQVLNSNMISIFDNSMKDRFVKRVIWRSLGVQAHRIKRSQLPLRLSSVIVTHYGIVFSRTTQATNRLEKHILH